MIVILKILSVLNRMMLLVVRMFNVLQTEVKLWSYVKMSHQCFIMMLIKTFGQKSFAIKQNNFRNVFLEKVVNNVGVFENKY